MVSVAGPRTKVFIKGGTVVKEVEGAIVGVSGQRCGPEIADSMEAGMVGDEAGGVVVVVLP